MVAFLNISSDFKQVVLKGTELKIIQFFQNLTLLNKPQNN